jgi:hypothetical protein
VGVGPRGVCAVGPRWAEGEMEQEREGGERGRKAKKETKRHIVGTTRATKEKKACVGVKNDKKKKKKTDVSLATLTYMGKIWTFYCILASPKGRVEREGEKPKRRQRDA